MAQLQLQQQQQQQALQAQPPMQQPPMQQPQPPPSQALPQQLQQMHHPQHHQPQPQPQQPPVAQNQPSQLPPQSQTQPLVSQAPALPGQMLYPQPPLKLVSTHDTWLAVALLWYHVKIVAISSFWNSLAIDGMSSLQAMGLGWPCPMLAFTSGSAGGVHSKSCCTCTGVPAAGVAAGLPSSMADFGGSRGHFKITGDFRIVDD